MMKIWVPLAVVGLLVAAYALFYAVSSAEAQGATSIGIANSVGLVAVIVGVVAAGLIMGRAAPHR